MRCPRLRHGAHISLLSCKAAVQQGCRLPGPGLAPSQSPARPACPRSQAGGRRKEALLRSRTPPVTLWCCCRASLASPEQRHPSVTDARQLRLFVSSPVQEISLSTAVGSWRNPLLPASAWEVLLDLRLCKPLITLER